MKRKKWWVVLLCAVGLFAFGATIAGTVYEDGDKPSKAIEKSPAVEAVDVAVESYALEYSVSQAEASRRLGRIEAIQEALASIRGLEAARVAGWGIDHRGDFEGWVLLTGDGPASAATAAVADAHSDVEIRTGAQHSYAELLTAQRGLSEELFAAELSSANSGAVGSTGQGTQTGPGVPGTPGGPGETEGGGIDAGLANVVTFLEPDMAGNAIRVGIDPGLAPEIGPLATVSELTFEQSKAVVAELLDDHIEVPFTVADGRGLVLAANFQGGETAGPCTSGFTARRARSGGYDYGVIIAGHCNFPGPNDTLSVNMKRVVLPFVYGWLSATADAQFHRIPIPSSGSHYVADDYLCRQAGSYPNPSCDVTGTTPRAEMPGDYVCHTGRNSGISCGRVVSISFTLGNICLDSAGADTVCDSVFVRAHGQFLRGCGGDSGGPVYRGGRAYGITAGVTDEDDCDSGGESVVFSGIREVESFLDVEVLTQPVTLNAP
ncbi:hypothetical protein [Candidatus Poriferisocius sp.]|uniref:hypothetical protein n=1 Tax=Candidatus Poriferisocius sp. TaxID=3101276 RepID=UPI003B01F3EB